VLVIISLSITIVHGPRTMIGMGPYQIKALFQHSLLTSLYKMF